MSRRERIALAIVLALAVAGCATVATAAYAWHRAGTVRIDVHEAGSAGSDVSVRVPGAIVNAAIALLPEPRIVEFDTQFAEFAPALLAISEHLEKMPDAVLVDVREGGESVRVERAGSEIVVRVSSGDERVEIAIPIRSARKALEKLGRIARARGGERAASPSVRG